MKKLSILSMGFYILFTILSHGAMAQKKTKLDNTKSSTEFVANSAETRPSFGEVFSPTMSKAIKDFSKSVKLASNQRWFESTDGFVVKYEDKNGIQCRADYDQKGRWIANTRYYAEKDLPKELRAWVKMDYLDFTINSVQELTFPDHIVYLIQLQNDEKWVHVRICDGEMDIVKEFDKSK